MSTDQPEASLPESPSVEIRACCDSDVEGVLPLLHQLWSDAERNNGMLRAAFQQGAKSESGRFLCATFGGEIVGFCSLTVRESLWQQGLLGHIDELVVDENYRGRGVGTQLLRRAEEIAQQMGCRRIELDSAFHRTQAHAFYERVGYTNRAFVFSKLIATQPTGGTTVRNLQTGSVGQGIPPRTMSRDNRSRVYLEPFDRRWAESVLGWITSPDEQFHWSAREGFPLTDATVFDEWHSDPEVGPYVLLIEDEIVAYGEIWLDQAERSAELGRLIVSPRHRRQGLGRLLIERLASVAHEAGYRQIWVRVLSTNAEALRCYELAGFIRASEAQEVLLNAAQRFQFVWMVR